MSFWFWVAISIMAAVLIGVVALFFRAPNEHQGWHNQGDGWPGPP